jgi:hypothetical protein
MRRFFLPAETGGAGPGRRGAAQSNLQNAQLAASWLHFVELASRKFELHDNTHSLATDTGYCSTCGQLVLPPASYGSGPSMSKRIGIAVSVLLHVLAVSYYLLRDDTIVPPTPTAPEGAMVYISPPAPTPLAPRAQPPSVQPPSIQPPTVARVPPPPQVRVQPPRPQPVRPKEEVFVPPVVAQTTPPPEQDMQSMIAARRAQRAATQPQAEPQESAEERGQRIARANIAGAQRGTSGTDRNGSGGVFSIMNQTSFGAEVKFRGWNENFKRSWTQQVKVERGSERDIETAIVKKMIELIRKEKPGDFVWDSHRLGRLVNLSARVEHATELETFLLSEFFPEYRRR